METSYRDVLDRVRERFRLNAPRPYLEAVGRVFWDEEQQP